MLKMRGEEMGKREKEGERGGGERERRNEQRYLYPGMILKIFNVLPWWTI